MRKIAHLSDLHFGREDPQVVMGLRRDLEDVQPDLVVVTGDLTQRAWPQEFAAATQFLRSLGAAWLAVPGNHDIPLDPLRRLWDPYGPYRRGVSVDLMPRHHDEEMAVLGLNTALPWVWKGGLVRDRGLAALRTWAKDMAPRLRIVDTHHPFSRPAGGGGHSLVRRASRAVLAMEEVGVDLVLTGHHHVGGHSESRTFVAEGPHRLVVARAGTATSVRMRGEPNSYNLVHADLRQIAVEQRVWGDDGFTSGAIQAYPRRAA